MKNKDGMTHQKYARVVVHMQETELLKPLLREDEKSIKKIQNLGDVKHV